MSGHPLEKCQQTVEHVRAKDRPGKLRFEDRGRHQEKGITSNVSHREKCIQIQDEA